LFGIFIGFYQANNYYTVRGFKIFIIPIVLFVILKEFLRYQILSKSEGSNLLFILTTILFMFLDISTSIYYESFSSLYDIFKFVALIFLPSVSKNIACTYISSKSGYLPNILWLLVTSLYVYLIPIVPNPNEYLLSLIRFLFPFVIIYRVSSFYQKVHDRVIERDYKKLNRIPLVLSIIVMLIIVYFTSGYFKYVAIAIASGSMSPEFFRGDVVVIDKIENNYSLIKEGNIIAYKYGDVVVVHRVINIVKDKNEYYFYTKGDANETADNYAVRGDMVIGIVSFKIPYIGFPTVWFNDL